MNLQTHSQSSNQLIISRPIEGESHGWWIPFKKCAQVPGVVLFRQTFPSVSGEDPVSIDITCNGTYRIWWNGTFVGRGPAHSGTEFKRIDRVLLDPVVLQDNNLILIECIWVPYKTAFCPPSDPGLWCRVNLGKQRHPIDESWVCMEHPSYRKQTVRRSPALTQEEHYDARNESLLDGDGWVTPVAVPGQTAVWSHLIERGIPNLKETVVRPAAVVKTAEISPEEFTPDSWPGFSIQSLSVNLLKEMPEEHTITRVDNVEELCRESMVPAIVSQSSWLDPAQPNQKNTTIILDFGEELAGYFCLDVEGNQGAVIDVAYAEFMKYGRVPALTHQVHYADRYILKEGRQFHEVNDWKGFRYVQLTLRHLTRPLGIYSAHVRKVHYPYNNEDAFQVEDETLNRIWEICDRGRRVCSQDRFVDCPWREQAPWLLDAWLAGNVVYGDPRLRAKTIEDFMLSQNEDGSFPTASYSKSFCHDQSFTLPTIIEQQFCETQDLWILDKTLPAMYRFYRWVDTCCNAEGLIENIGPVHLDWAHFPDKSGCLSILNGLFGWSLQSLSRMAAKAGRKDIIEYCAQRTNTLKQAVNAAFWDKDKQMYRDSLAAEPHFSEQAQAICVLAGFYDDNAATLLAKVSQMRPGEITKTNLYFAAFWIEALTVAGLRQEALAYIRRVWGRMVEEGATTPWEIEQRFGGYFHPGYWHLAVASSCHGGYASYPQYWLQREVLGVHGPDMDGKICVRPGDDLFSSAEGVVHLSGRVIRVAWNSQHRHLKVSGIPREQTVNVPSGWTLDVSD
jgi:alpha-L-rhamnosidase